METPDRVGAGAGRREEKKRSRLETGVPGRKRLEIGAGLGGPEVLDAAAEEALLGEFLGEDDLGGNENGGLAGLVGDGDLDEGLGVIPLAALETQAALGHVLALDDVIAALGMADAGGVGNLDAGMLAAIGMRRGRLFASRRRLGDLVRTAACGSAGSSLRGSGLRG